MARLTNIQVRRDTAANWTTTNPTLASGEVGFETDTLKVKIGNGSTAWASLAYTTAVGNITGLGTGVATALASAVTGSGSVVLATTPTLTNPKIGLTYTAKTAAYTFASGDEGNIFSMNNAATQQFNIPTDATFNFAVGTQFNVFWTTGAGQPTIGATTPGTTTVVSTAAVPATPKLRVANSMATAMKIAANSWIVTGDIS